MSDNGRYGGGSAGSEHRYHYPAVDAAKFDAASMGNTNTQDSRWTKGQSENVPESRISTADGPARGTLGGAVLPDDRGGFC